MIQEFIKQLEKKEDLDFLSMQSAIELIMTCLLYTSDAADE